MPLAVSDDLDETPQDDAIEICDSPMKNNRDREKHEIEIIDEELSQRSPVMKLRSPTKSHIVI